MSHSHPISNMFTIIRNAIKAKHSSVMVPFSNLKLAICKIMKDEGFIKYYEIQGESTQKKTIKVGLKYDDEGVPMISEIRAVSLPGKRKYVQKANISKVLNGFGVSFYSTSKGVLSGRAARLSNVGGEYLGYVY